MTNTENIYYLIALIVATLFFVAAYKFFMGDNSLITSGEVAVFLNEKGADKESAALDVAKKVLRDTGMDSLYGDGQGITLKIAAGCFRDSGKKSDKIIVVQCGLKNAVAALYEETNGGLRFISKVDTFFNITDCKIIELEKEKRDIIIFREEIDQSMGAFEKSSYLRGYYYKDGGFHLVLSLLESCSAYWNELWQKENQEETKKSWLLIKDTSDIFFNSKDISFAEEKTQIFAVSRDKNSVEIPKNNNFEVVKSRKIKNTYIWSSKWESFIMYEAKLTETGEYAAVIEDLSYQPFGLIEEKEPGIEKVRIKRATGEIELIYKNEIEQPSRSPGFTGVFVRFQ